VPDHPSGLRGWPRDDLAVPRPRHTGH
jgi:hypothetical protein